MPDVDSTCYVCFEECQELSSCKCINIYLHNNCQRKIIKNLNSTICTICKHEYTNILEIYTHRVLEYNKNCSILFLLLVTTTMMLLITMIEIVVGLYLIFNFENKIFVIFYFILLSFSCSLLVFIKIKTITFLKNVCNKIIKLKDEVIYYL
jgi:hypothetical protein